MQKAPNVTTTGTLTLRTELDRGAWAAAGPVVSIEGVEHAFGTTPVLLDVDLTILPGEIVLLTGPSGSGKTTLLTLIGALRAVQRGSVHVLGRELGDLGEEERVALRRRIGFIFQGHNLFASLTALQNVKLGLALHPGDKKEQHRRARSMLERVGLGDFLHQKPDQLSGGQRQRVAVARALAARPPLVLADEPTAALDAETGAQVIGLLQELGRRQGTATILVTHDNRILEAADRIVNMVDGRLVSDVAVGASLEVCEFLARVPVFSRYTPGALAEIVEQMSVHRFEAGTVLFREGDPGDAFYIVREGAVRIEDTERPLAELEEGAFFGELALVSGNPRNATAVVARDAVLLTLSKQEFRAALEREKDFQSQLREVLLNRH